MTFFGSRYLTDESFARILPSAEQHEAVTKLPLSKSLVQGVGEAVLRERGIRQREQQRLGVEERRVAAEEKRTESLVQSNALANALAWRNRPRRPSTLEQISRIFGAFK